MRFSFFKLLVVLGLLAGGCATAQIPPATPPATQPATQPADGFGPAKYQEAVLPPVPLEGFTFTHPMTVINQAELAEVKRRIAAHIEPQASAFAKLLHDADAAQSFQPDPPDTMNLMGAVCPTRTRTR